MYPGKELTTLAARKALLRVRIARHRLDCVDSFAQLTRPLALIDRLYDQWKALPSWVKAGVPLLGLALKLGRRPRKGKLRVVRTLLRWAPVGWKLWQGLRAGRPA